MKKSVSLLLVLILTMLSVNIVMAKNYENTPPYSVSYLQDIDGAEYVKHQTMDDKDMDDGKMIQRSLEMYDVLSLYLKNSDWDSIIKPFRDALGAAGFNEKTNTLKNGDIQYIYSKDINVTDSEVFIILGEKESKAIINESGLVYIEHALLQFDVDNTVNNENSKSENTVESTSTLLVHSINGNLTVLLNDENINFDVPPQIINGRTMVPLRAIFEAIGAKVDWNNDTQTVTSTKDKTTISLTINNPTMYVNGESVTLDSPACLVGGRTLVPVRAISEAFNIKVEWKETVIEKEVTMYALDGRTQVVPESQVEANKAVGWYTEPMTTMYALDGRTQIIPQSQIEANKAVGWYTEAEYNAYIKAEKEKNALTNPISAPFDTIEEMRQATYNVGKCYKKGNFYVGKNSADGIFLHWAAKNVTNKTIKYLTITFEFYNAVGDLTKEEISSKTSKTMKLTGPIEPQEAFYIADIVGYSVDCQSIKITDIKVDYMDGTSSNIYYGYKTEWYRPGVAF